MASFAGMGAIPGNGGCGFRVWAPNAEAVRVTGDWSGWNGSGPALTSEGNGYWAGQVAGVGPGSRYRFLIRYRGTDHERIDAYARDVDSFADGRLHGVVPDRAAAWAPFATPRLADLILYQVHVGSFAGRNDGIAVTEVAPGNWVATCADIIPKLDYIRGLGFNALALLPLGEHPRPAGQAHMGYAPTNWFAPESDFGTLADVRRLVDEAHRRGLAVIFDVVFNHASIDENHYWQYDGHPDDGGIYFEGGGDSSFGRIPAHWKQEVRNFFLDNARMWLDDYRADGLRFDAAHFIQKESLQHIIFNLRENPFWRDKLFIAEWSGDDRGYWPRVISDLGFDSLWGMAGPYGFREAIKRGAFGGDAVDALLNVMELAPYRNHWNVVRYLLGSHDQIRDRESGREGDHRYAVEKLGGRGDWTARAQARMGWALTAAIPGIPMLFMGSEGHMPGYWWPTLDDNPADREHRFDWLRVGDDTGAPMQRLVHDANQMRWQHAALRSHSLDVCHVDRSNNVLAFRRWDESGDVVLVVAHFGESEWRGFDYAVRTAVGGRWQEIFNSQAPLYGGYDDSGNGPDARSADGGGWLPIRLPKWSVLAFRRVD